jgi:hypothetical protein
VEDFSHFYSCLSVEAVEKIPVEAVEMGLRSFSLI